MLPIANSIPRVALVTGAGLRLGRAIALELAQAGFSIGVHYNRSLDAAEAVAREVRAAGQRAAVVQADLADEAATDGLLPAVVAALGPVGVLVNNASRFERDEWHDTTRASWDLHMEPNLRAPFVLTQAMARGLPATAEGVVINLLDQRVWSLTPHFVSYTVSKAGLWSLTQQMALALAPRIRVNGVGPGPALPSSRQTEAQFARQCAQVPLQRGTSPAEVAAAVRVLLGLPSVTGQMLALDGGQHLQWGPASAAVEE